MEVFSFCRSFFCKTPEINVTPVDKNPLNFDASIPVVDISQFENPATRKQFLESLENALKKGFFAVINSTVNLDTIAEGYEAYNEFFSSPKEVKMVMNRPDLNGQRGYVPGETALNGKEPDNKEFVHIGPNNNIYSSKILEEKSTKLYDSLKDVAQPIMQGIALTLGQREDFFTGMTDKGDNLMRVLNYPPNPKDGLWAGEHTDIDLLTILPYASEKGLEIEIDGVWKSVVVPKNALIINVGDMLESFSNGRYPSCTHRVRSTTPDTSRQSIVFFIHPASETVVSPIRNFPVGTRIEHLMLRLFSLRLLKDRQAEDSVIKGRFIREIEEMVKAGTAAAPVKRWYRGFQETHTVIQKERAQKA